MLIMTELLLSIERVWVTMSSMPQPPYRVAVLTRCGLVYCRESSIGPTLNVCVQAPSWRQCDDHGIGRGREPKRRNHTRGAFKTTITLATCQEAVR